MSLCLPDFEYNNSTGLCDKFEIIPPTDCTASNNQYNKNFLYNPDSKICEYNNKTTDNTTGSITETSINNDPTCAPNTITLANRQCKRLLVSIEPNKPPAPQLASQQAIQLAHRPIVRTTNYQVYEPSDRPSPLPSPQPIVRTTNYILYIILFIMFVIALGIGYFYINKKK